jgi:hypothetical protein
MFIVDDTKVRIQWNEPTNGGSAIVSYSIMIQKSDSTYATETQYCDGTSPTIVSTRTCDIPFTVLRDVTTFNLDDGDLIVVKIAASNIIGMGPYSTPNTVGVAIETEPAAPTSAPKATAYSESDATIEMSSTMRLLSVSSPILYYELVWDQGSNGATWTSYTVTTNNIVTVTGLTSGQEYQFKYRL